MKYQCRASFLLLLFLGSSLGATPVHQEDLRKYCVDFDSSMDFRKKDIYSKVRLKNQRDPLTRFCRTLYKKNNLSRLRPQNDPIIPTIVHVIWVGPNMPPPVFYRCLESIQKFLPSWELHVWTDEDLPLLTLENQRFYDEETNYGAKSDILRYELLYQFGGIYLDVDFVLTQPLDILNRTYEFYTCLGPSSCKAIIANGIIGSIPGHPILKNCIQSIKKNRDQKKIIERTGPILFQKSFYEAAQTLSQSKIIAFPRSYFFPLEMHEGGKKIHDVKPETFGIHYWTGSWTKRRNGDCKNNGAQTAIKTCINPLAEVKNSSSQK